MVVEILPHFCVSHKVSRFLHLAYSAYFSASCSYEIEQKPGEEDVPPSDETMLKFGYGFAWRRHGVMGKLAADVDNLIDLEFADDSPLEDRVSSCLKFDKRSFDPDHYVYVVAFTYYLPFCFGSAGSFRICCSLENPLIFAIQTRCSLLEMIST